MTPVGSCLIFVFLSAFAVAQDQKEWWKSAAVYQIYPLSFRDKNNDGKGDLRGISEKILYLKETGIEAVWLSPIYASPMLDFGYDISDYKNIHEWYGNMSDFNLLINIIHELGMKLIMDFVPNHTSNQHDWFVKSEERVPKYADYYVWKDPKGFDAKGNPIPPNNWVSIFSGPAWTYSSKRKQFYLHHFLKEQPDLNFTNPMVVQEMNEVLQFWMRKGVDGFRLDAVPFLIEDKNYADEPKSGNNVADPNDPDFLDHVYTQHQKETYALVQQWRSLIENESNKDGRNSSRVLMVEAYGNISQVMEYFGTADKLGAHFPFNFNLLGINKNSTAESVRQLITSWLDNIPEFGYSNWLVGNHDQHRVGSKIGADLIDGINMLVTLLPGLSVTYYGEEIGMVNNDDITYEEGVDPQGLRFPKEQFKYRSRDFERTPFQWDASTNAGFNSGKKPWLPIHKNYKEVNLKEQKEKTYSHYTIFTDLLRLKKTPAICQGTTLVHKVGKGSLGLLRSLGSNNFVIVIVNFSQFEDVVNLNEHFLVEKRKLKVYTTDSESGFLKGDLVDPTNVKLPKRSAVVFVTNE